jgi:N-acetylmuramoyl-L-alanine amidase
MRRTLVFFAILWGLIAAGCAPPPEPQIDNVYRGLSEDVPRLDPVLLTGRRIVIDPGHGGYFTGTSGAQGLEESSVNLGVALYLWGLLHEAGAEVYLTRSAEKDFLAGADSTVTDDLKVRVAAIDSLQPDIVVSIHHNAQPERDPSKNAIETYYKIGDPASRDLAFAVHRHLARNLGIAQGEVRPGNYYILREVAGPAILGEASYLTNPGVEANLRISEKQRLEAEAYFLGILDYFSHGTPVVRALTPAPDDTVVEEVPLVSYEVTDIGGMGIDPSGIEMTVNEAPVEALLGPDGRTIEYRLPWDTPNGVYDVSLVARNILGNSSSFTQRRFLLDYPAKRAVFDSSPETVPAEGGLIHFRARLLDERGLSIADGSVVAVSAWHRPVPGAGEKAVKGEWVEDTVRVPGGDAHVSVADGVADFSVDVPPGCPAVRVAVMPATPPGVDYAPEGEFGPTGFVTVVEAGTGSPGIRSLVMLDRRTGSPVPNVVLSNDSSIVSAEPRGSYLVLSGEAARLTLHVRASGYRPADIGPGGSDTLYLDPWYDGALTGKRFVVNAEGAPPRGSDTGPLGLAGSFVDLRVARYLGEYLTAAGAEVRQARLTEETPTDRDIVIMTNRFGAGLYVEIRYRNDTRDAAPTVRTFYYPGSARGLAVARAIGAALSRTLGLSSTAPADTVTYPLQQTACPAVIVEPPSLGTTEEEIRLSGSWYQRNEAYGIFGGILSDAGVANTAALHIELSADSTARQAEGASNWLVTVDDTWRLVTSPDGKAAFDWLPPGAHRVVITRAGRAIGPLEVVLESGETRTLATATGNRR